MMTNGRGKALKRRRQKGMQEGEGVGNCERKKRKEI
jgi:hypothetical protein